MKCVSCGRGLTWQRICRDAGLYVLRADVIDGEQGETYCGLCLEDVELEEGDVALVLLGDAVHPKFQPDGVNLRHRTLVWS